jgi:hypothetical protein
VLKSTIANASAPAISVMQTRPAADYALERPWRQARGQLSYLADKHGSIAARCNRSRALTIAASASSGSPLRNAIVALTPETTVHGGPDRVSAA